MRPRHAVHLTPSVSLRLSQLPCYKQNEQSSFHSPYSLPSSASCKSFSCNTYEPPRKCCKQKAYDRAKSFSCNTYEPPRKCCKQKAYDRAKSFSCNTYKKQGGHILQPKSFSLASPFPDVSTCRRSHVPSPILRTLFQVPSAASPVFATLTKTAGVGGYSSHFGTRSSINWDRSRHFRSVNGVYPDPVGAFSVVGARPDRVGVLNHSFSFNLQLSTFNLHVLPRLNSSRKCNLLMAVPEAVIDPRASHGSLQSEHGQRRQQ